MRAKPGDVVTYRGTISDVHAADFGQETICKGTCNGESVVIEGTTYIPVWVKRRDQEPTTVFVHEANVLEVES